MTDKEIKMSKKKFCVNCIHRKQRGHMDTCYRPQFEVVTVDLVTGIESKRNIGRTCDSERLYSFPMTILEGTCGKGARFYKEKKS